MTGFPGWSCLAPDLWGPTRGDRPLVATMGVAPYADDLVALLDLLKIRRTVVCGLSMGGYVAFELLRRYPERVQALALFSTRAEADSPEGKANRDATVGLVQRDGLGALADAMLPKLLGSNPSPDVVSAVRAMITGSSTAGILGAIRAMRNRRDATPLLSTISVPTLVLGGQEDTLFPAGTSMGLAARIRNARLVEVRQAGHLAPLEQPGAVNEALTNFLMSLA